MSDSSRGYVEEVRRSARAEQLRARAPRILFIAFLAITCLAGIKAIVSPPQPAVATEEAGLVDQAAEDFALRFARHYLTYDASDPDAREAALEPFLPAELDADGGLVPGRGSQSVEWVQVAQHQEALAGGVVIVVAAQIAGKAEPTYLAVPVQRRPDEALQLVTYPSIVGPPTYSRAPAPSFEEVDDRAVSVVVERVIRNYLAGSEQNISADLAPDAEVSLPAEPMEVELVDELVWAPSTESPAVLITVEAVDEAGALWTFTYEVGIDQSTDRTTVTFVETIPNAT